MFDIKNNEPSLCACCLKPSGAILLQIDNKYYGVCNNGHHIEEIKTRVRNKMEITRQSNLNYKSVDYAIAEVKSLYQQLAKKNKTYELHKWEGEERKKFLEH